MRVFGQGHVHGYLDGRHDGFAIGIHEIEAKLMQAFVFGTEGGTEGDGALGMHGGELRGVNSIERAEEIQLDAIIFSGRVAENCYLDVHTGKFSCKSKWKRSSKFFGWSEREAAFAFEKLF